MQTNGKCKRETAKWKCKLEHAKRETAIQQLGCYIIVQIKHFPSYGVYYKLRLDSYVSA